MRPKSHARDWRLYDKTCHNTLLMTTLSHSSEFDATVVDLAAIIDVHAGDYPLLSVCHKAHGPDVTWLYAHLVIEVFIDKNRPVSIRSRVLGTISVCVGSLQQAMALLRRTEGLRQKRDMPYIRLR